jgi:alanine racemase
MLHKLNNAIGYHALKHICNSGAITRFKNAHYNMVRLGIGMYGVGFNEVEKIHLENISSLKTRVSQIKELEVGETVGYNRKGVATKHTKIATIPIGYADGFSRNWVMEITECLLINKLVKPLEIFAWICVWLM